VASLAGHRDINKIGEPVDRDEWNMTPPTVNAGYTPQKNEIMFPAGVLQPPLYDARMDDAPNYGDTGSNIGHELTHGFDDLGRQFDANGNLRDWWTKADAPRSRSELNASKTSIPNTWSSMMCGSTASSPLAKT